MSEPIYVITLRHSDKKIVLRLAGDMEPSIGAVESIKETTALNQKNGYELVAAGKREADFISQYKIGEV